MVLSHPLINNDVKWLLSPCMYARPVESLCLLHVGVEDGKREDIQCTKSFDLFLALR